jgi:hypothetical protein
MPRIFAGGCRGVNDLLRTVNAKAVGKFYTHFEFAALLASGISSAVQAMVISGNSSKPFRCRGRFC